MTQVTLKTIEQNDNVGMFSICFDGNSESEFEKFRPVRLKSDERRNIISHSALLV